jgi:ADP-ribosylglycohydrolase
MDKIEASLMLSSYFETVGFKNGQWEFNYQIVSNTFEKYMAMWNILLHHYLILGGATSINIKDWYASDDTILIIATAKAVIKNGGIDNYIDEYVNSYDLLVDAERASGNTTLKSIKLLKNKNKILNDNSMYGNGAAIRTSPIGLKWYNDIEKVIDESINASRVTHNYYLGYLGGMVSALFTAFAMKNIPAWKWIDELLILYNNKTIEKYYPKDHDLNDLNEFIGYWKKYNETRISKLKYKNSLKFFILPDERAEYLAGFYPSEIIKKMTLQSKSIKDLKWWWHQLGSTGLDACIYALDCLLLCMQTPNSKDFDLNNIEYSWENFLTLVAIHPGDSDSTAAIGGAWFGALNGYGKTENGCGFNKKRLEQLEFYKELLELSIKLI